MDDRVVGTEVDALQDVLLRSLVLHVMLIPGEDDGDDAGNDNDNDNDNDEKDCE